jgi:hypothetical protein
MGAPLVVSLTSALLGTGTLDVLGAAVKLLAERVSRAHEKYEQTSSKADDPVEARRDEIIREISKLRNRVALCVSDPELQQKIWCLLMEQTAEAYEAVSERSLDLVKDTAAQIESVLDSYEHAVHYRRRARWIAVVVSLVSLGAIGWFLYFAQTKGMTGEAAIPILGVPSCVLLWSVIGSFASIVYRFTNAGDRELEDPLRWLFSRPLTGIIMGAITFLVIKAGLMTMAPVPGSSSTGKLGTNEVMWLVAFLAGFSDRFSDGLLKSLVGRFGGDKTADLVAIQMSSRQASTGILDHLTAFVKLRKRPPAPSVAQDDSLDAHQGQALVIVENSRDPVTHIAKN